MRWFFKPQTFSDQPQSCDNKKFPEENAELSGRGEVLENKFNLLERYG